MLAHVHRRPVLLLFIAAALLVPALRLRSADPVRAGETPTPEPTIVAEITSKRTADSSTYLLSNGAYRARLYSADRYYRSEKDAWVPIDPTLVRSPEGGPAVTAAAPVTVTVSDAAPDAAPLTVTSGKWTLTMDLLGCEEAGMSVKGAAATFPAVAKDASLTYTATGTGVKEVITLASAAAPASFTWRLAHPGLELRRDPAAQWGLYEPGAEKALFLIGPMSASDSSKDEAGEPAWCDGARLEVRPGRGESTLTFTLPQKWLDDPARIYPVLCDPQADLNGAETRDTYLSEGYPSTAYGASDQLACGNMNSGAGRCWTLIRFPQLADAIPAGRHISDADLLLRQFWQPAGHHDDVRIAKLGHSAILWGNASTWNNAASDIVLESDYPPLEVAGDDWLQLNCGGAVQDWLQNGNNKGWLFYETSGSGSGYSRKFRSNEYGNSLQRPFLEVDYEAPGVTVGGLAASYHVGETVTVTAQATSVAYTGQIRNIRVGVNRSEGASANYHGMMAWFKEPPTANPAWVYQSCHGGGYVAYYDSTTFNVSHAEPVLGECSWDPATRTVSFAFRATKEWTPLPSTNDIDSIIEMRANGQGWSGGWTDEANSFAMAAPVVAPDPLTSLTCTTSPTSSWLAAGAQSNDNVAGRGAVTLRWPRVAGATGYWVYLWDGTNYEKVDTIPSGSTTTWTSGSAIYPTDAQIAAMNPASPPESPFASPYKSCSLRDNPNALYEKMGGSTSDAFYRLKVVPVNNGAAADEDACAELRVTLDSRTKQSAEDGNAHTVYDLGEWDGHELACELDTGALTSAATDLEIATFGPAAALTRTCSSVRTTAGLFAPGWRFNFEQNLLIQATSITYTDPEGQAHVFARSGSTCTTPNGFLGGLTADGSGWRLTFPGQTYLSFDSSGKLTAETDAGGEQTTYTWSGATMTQVTAASGQTITLTYSGTKLAGASYATAAGTRVVSYAAASPWQVTYFPGTGCERKLTYGYDGSSRLATLTQNDWPAAGQNVSEIFIYAAGKLTRVNFAGYDASTKPDARCEITYDSATQATASRFGTVNGTANQAMNVEVFTWAESSAAAPGLTATHTTGTGSLALTETYAYAADRQLAMTASSDGGLTSDAFNTSHDLTSETVSSAVAETPNQLTTYAYDGLHRLTSECAYSAPQAHSTITSSYSGSTNELSAQTTYDTNGTTVLAAETHEYDTSGRVTKDQELISGSDWTETCYSDFAPCGEPQTTIQKAVKLAYGAGGQDLTSQASYDALGSLLSETDAAGRTTETSTYDIAGQQLTSTDAAAVVSHTVYDRMGNAVETWETASGTSVKANWTTTAFDALGQEISVTTKLSDNSGNPTTQSMVTATSDGSGNEITSDDSALGGQASRSIYDGKGYATQTWAESVYDTLTAARSQRNVYDAAGNVTCESEPGNPTAPTPSPTASCQVTTYAPDGSTLAEKQPNGSMESYEYDGAGNQVASAGNESGTSARPFQRENVYDAAGREKSATDAQHSHTGLETTTTLDALGRAVQETAVRDDEDSTSTERVFNDLGQVLRSVDANGVTTTTTYDAHGEATGVVKGTKTTTSVYNANTGRLESTTDGDGNVVSYTYDPFGNVTEELHQASGGAVLRDVETKFDSLGRPTGVTEAVSGRSQSFSYPVNAATGTQETLDYSSAPPHTSVQITRNGREMETARTASLGGGVTVTRSVADPSGRDTADRWTAATIQQSGRSAKTMGRSFDAAGRLATQSGLGFASGNSASYGYDPVSGLKTSQDLPLALGGAISDSYSYYPGGRLATATTNGTSATTTFDEVGNLVGEESDAAGTIFAYDAANRLQSTAMTPTTDGAETTTTYYGWDEGNGWRTCQGPAPNPTPTNEPVTFSYNARGRMSSYANTDTSTSASYTYDASGQRTRSVVTVNGSQTTTLCDYDGLTLMSLAASQGSTTWRIDYLYDEEGTLYGGVYRSPADSSSPVYFTAVTNDHGDVLELCDADGAAFAAYRYDAWGLPQAAGSYATGVWTQASSLVTSTLAGQVASRQVLRYASYAFDSESGLYYCSARYYDPSTRQWTTGDPAKADGEESAWQYCGGNPVDCTDATGESFKRFNPTKHLGSKHATTKYLRYVLRTDACFTFVRGYKYGYDWRGLWRKVKWFYRWNRPNNQWDFKKARYYRKTGWRFMSKVINADDFGNIHFGFVGYYYPPVKLKMLTSIGWAYRLRSGPLALVKGARKECHDNSMIKWGWNLAKRWGIRGKGTQYYGIFKHKK